MTVDDLTALNEQIAAMARAGLPLDQGLASLGREMGRGRLRTVTEKLAEDLRGGFSLSEALARRAGQVPPFYANLVTAGVRTGRLPQVLTTLTTYARSIAATRTTLIDAMFYPAIVLIVGLALFAAMSFFVLPEVDQIFKEFNLKLPLITESVLTIGRYPVEIIVIPGSILLGGLFLAWLLGRYTPRGRRIAARAVYWVPLVGRLIRAARLAAFTDLLGMLVEFGVPLPTAFRLAGAASSDPALAARTREVEEKLNAGESLAAALGDRRLVPEWVAWLAVAGERQNALASSLREIASMYRRQVESQSTVLRTILPSLVVLTTAGVLTVAFILTIMLPFILLLEGLSK